MTDVAVPAFKKRGNKASIVRKRPATPPRNTSEASESDYTDDEAGVQVKRRKKDGVAVAASGAKAVADLSKSTQFQADRTASISANDFATKTSNLYAGDAKAKPEVQDVNYGEDGAATTGQYKGASGYGSFIQKSADAPTRQVGPLKAPTNIRTITTTDFAPDVCKDYKQTGFCGFGDGCKFLHAREDYAQGWQLDRDWEKAGGGAGKAKAGTKPDDTRDEEEKMLDNIPFACIICKEAYKMPVVTKCGHYFCEKCAMQRYMKEKKRTCAACGADTNGTFNVARKLKDLLEKKKQRAAEQEKAAKEAEEADAEQ